MALRIIHTENIPGTDRAIRNKANDYLIDRALQASRRWHKAGGPT